MTKPLYKMTATGDIVVIKSGLVYGVKNVDTVPGKRGLRVIINDGLPNRIQTQRFWIDESEFSLNSFIEGAPKPEKVVRTPKKELPPAGPVYVIGLTKEELQQVHSTVQAVSDMLLKKIVQVVMK